MEKKGFASNLIVAIAAIAVLGAAVYLGLQYFREPATRWWERQKTDWSCSPHWRWKKPISTP